ncbi:hypothetical protein GOV09_06185 [Candidatus Woesearchaeota archaeon]|nr:hypothetical protein [Candidatus Woesearchaeota archaeon]
MTIDPRKRLSDAYKGRLSEGRIKAFLKAPYDAFGGKAVYDNYRDRVDKRSQHPVRAAAIAPVAVAGSALGGMAGGGAGKVIDATFNRSGILLLLALLYNFLWEVRNPAVRFGGFDLAYFQNAILGQGFIGIYNMFHFNIFFLAVLFAWFNLRGGKPHILRVWLGMILVTYLLSSIPVLFTYLGTKNIFEFFILFFTAIYLSFYQTSMEDFIATIVVMWVFYNLYMFGAIDTLGSRIHFFFFILFYIFFCMGETFKADRVRIKYWLLLLILFDFFMPSFFASAFPGTTMANLPFLTFGFLIFAQVYQPSWLTSVLIIFFVAFYFVSFIRASTAFQDAINQNLVDEEQLQERRNVFKLSYWKSRYYEWMNKSIYYGSGQDYYTSQVDANAKKNLGVYLEDIGKNPLKYFSDQKITLSATLTAENFISDDDEFSFENITVDISCAAYKAGEKVVDGGIWPSGKLIIESYDVQNILCTFKEGELEEGKYEIRFRAKFNFATQAYLKRYFVSKERIGTLRKQRVISKDLDILKINDISDINPITKNSVGPVQIGVSERMPVVIKLDGSQDTKELFNVEMKNAWLGDIAQIKDIEFYLPEGASIDPGTCDLSMTESAVLDQEFYKGYRYFHLRENTASVLQNPKGMRQSCGLLFKVSQKDILLQPGDVTTRYFRMAVSYDYVLSDKHFINIADATT